MERLIGDLLDVSRIDAGTFAVSKRPLTVTSVVEEVVSSFHDDAAAAGVTIRSHVAARLPTVDADHQRLVQALSNLVSNALRFTGSGGCIGLNAQGDEGRVRLSVEDTGIGIAPDQLSWVFDRFWQADRTSGGAGLGLAIVKGIVESHGGTIHVESQLGQGTTFVLELPASVTAIESA
jgi:signal transduction histidine kinase